LSVCISSTAAADQGADHDAAVAVFQEGTKLVGEGNCPAAIPKFQDSLRREEGVGAHLNLADCYEKVGAPDKAWLEYKAAERFATLNRNDERREVAHRGAYNLERKLVRLTLSIALFDGVELRINGVLVDRELLASRLVAVAPGAFKVVARAPGKKSVTLEGSGTAGESKSVAIVFEDEALPPPPPPKVEPPAAPPPTTQRTAGLIAGGAGIVSVAVGAVFGVVAIGAKSNLKSSFAGLCTGTYPTGSCPPTAHDTLDPLEKKASTAASLSTAFLIVGGVVAATGLTLYLTAPSSAAGRTGKLRVSPAVGTASGGVVLGGSW
jgi:hypothetical protein